MSQTETYRGVLRPMERDTDLESFCRELLVQNEISTEIRWSNRFSDILADELCDKYVIVGEDVFEILEKEELLDVYEATELPSGDVSFVVQYHNGCCCFGEAIEAALKDRRN